MTILVEPPVQIAHLLVGQLAAIRVSSTNVKRDYLRPTGPWLDFLPLMQVTTEQKTLPYWSMSEETCQRVGSIHREKRMRWPQTCGMLGFAVARPDFAPKFAQIVYQGHLATHEFDERSVFRSKCFVDILVSEEGA